jgi:hypothetical protein
MLVLSGHGTGEPLCCQQQRHGQSVDVGAMQNSRPFRPVDFLL